MKSSRICTRKFAQSDALQLGKAIAQAVDLRVSVRTAILDQPPFAGAMHCADLAAIAMLATQETQRMKIIDSILTQSSFY